MILFSSLFYLSLEQQIYPCRKEYEGGEEVMARCFLSGAASFADQKQTAIYLHNNNKDAKLNIKPKRDSSFDFTITSGNGVQIMDSNVDVTCVGSDKCFITVWHTSYDKDGGRYVSDGAGCSIFSEGSFIPGRFPVFFDFGDSARFSAGDFYHKRETGVTLYYVNSTDNNKSLVEKIVNKGNNIDIKGPSILHISSTIYTKAKFNFIIGSTVTIPKEFSNKPNAGNFSLYSFSKDKSSFDPSPNVGPDPISILLAKEQKGWYVLSIIMVSLTAITFVSSVTSCACIISSHIKSKKNH